MANVLPPKKRNYELKVVLQSIESGNLSMTNNITNDDPNHSEIIKDETESTIAAPTKTSKATSKCQQKSISEGDKEQLPNPVVANTKIAGSTSKSNKTAQKSGELKPLINSNICRFCGKFYATATELVEHETNHTVNKELLCPQCGMGFARRSYLVEHACIHSGEKPHKCYYCDRAFTLRCNLVRHVRIHTGEKPFVCSICKKDFTLKKNMIEHKRTHTGERPFDCKLCDQSFSRRSSLVRHLRIHTGEKCYECNECHKKFSWKYYLQRHMATHSRNKTRKRRSRNKNKQPKGAVSPQQFPLETNFVNCENYPRKTLTETQPCDKFVEHSYAMDSNPIHDSSFKIKEELDTTEEIVFKEESDNYEGNEPAGFESELPLQQEPKQPSLVEAPVIISTQSLREEISTPPPQINPVISQSNDMIQFRMTRNEFESFCGRRLHVRLHRLEDVPFEMQEE